MGGKSMPELHLVGTNKNMTYKKLHGLRLGQDLPITCHCVFSNETLDWMKMKLEMKTADIVLVLIGSSEDYNRLCPIGHHLPEKCIFVIEDFPDRERCLNKKSRALLVDAESYATEVVEKMIDIIMYDSVIALDYQDIFSCTGWRTTVTYRRFPSSEEAIAGMKKESQKMKNEMAKDFSLLFVDGNYTFSEVWDIVTVMDGDEEGTYMIGCSYGDGAGFGVLWFSRDHKESETAVEKWEKPFKKHKVNWFKIGFFVSTLVCFILGAKLWSWFCWTY